MRSLLRLGHNRYVEVSEFRFAWLSQYDWRVRGSEIIADVLVNGSVQRMSLALGLKLEPELLPAPRVHGYRLTYVGKQVQVALGCLHESEFAELYTELVALEPCAAYSLRLDLQPGGGDV